MTTAAAVPVAGWADVLVRAAVVASIVGLGLCVAWRRIDEPRLRRRLQWAGSLLFFVPQLPVLLAWNVAVPLVTPQRLLLGIHVLGSAAVALVTLRRRAGTRRSRAVTVVVAMGMVAGGVALAGPAVRNLVSPPVPVAGRVLQASAGYRTYAPVLDIGGQHVRVTHDLARQLRNGMRVEGLALRGTRHLVRVRILSDQRRQHDARRAGERGGS